MEDSRYWTPPIVCVEFFERIQYTIRFDDLISTSYQHIILGSRVATKPNPPRGGILADDMGLGKTLIMISAIAMSIADAVESAKQPTLQEDTIYGGLRTKSTLVIVPSPSKLHQRTMTCDYC